jgi:peptidoglycan/xylan/chitin deacetylase (PgdA/CDA1 family)
MCKPAVIVLLHDGGGNRHQTVKALPQVISGLKAQGYRFVTIPELLQIQVQEQIS